MAHAHGSVQMTLADLEDIERSWSPDAEDVHALIEEVRRLSSRHQRLVDTMTSWIAIHEVAPSFSTDCDLANEAVVRVLRRLLGLASD